MQDDKLLTQYARDGSNAAFSQLLARHLTLVYRTCRRELGSDALAEDAAQVVFLLLARKAKSLRAGSSLAGWLYRTAVFVAKDVRKQEARRVRREEAVMQETVHAYPAPDPTVWDAVEPHLNAALSALTPADREAVLLRFLEGHTLAETGDLLGLTEDAARMRVTRAVVKMRRYLSAHGAVVTGAILTGLLTSEAVRPLPVHAAAAVTQGTLQAISAGPIANVLSLSKGVSHTMKILKLKYASLATVLILGGAALPPLTRALSSHNVAVPTQTRIKAASMISSKPKQHLSQSMVADTSNILTQQLSHLRLHDGFTLVYRVTQRDVRTSAMLAYQNQTPSPPSSFIATVSARDGRLLFLTQIHKKMLTRVGNSYVTTLNHTQAVILEGDREYETSDSQDAMINAEGPRDGTPYQDENISRLPFFPLPGTGLPGMDLVQSPALVEKTSDGQLRFKGRVPRFNIVGEEPYKSGTIDAVSMQGHLKVLVVRDGLEADPRQTWHYSDHQWFQEHWIGAQMQAATYYRLPGVVSSKQKYLPPSFLTDYQLVSAENQPLAASAFDPKTYLAKGAHVGDTADGISFDFDPQAGTLNQQASDALSHQKT